LPASSLAPARCRLCEAAEWRSHGGASCNPRHRLLILRRDLCSTAIGPAMAKIYLHRLGMATGAGQWSRVQEAASLRAHQHPSAWATAAGILLCKENPRPTLPRAGHDGSVTVRLHSIRPYLPSSLDSGWTSARRPPPILK
jgi:hypothetical protein